MSRVGWGIEVQVHTYILLPHHHPHHISPMSDYSYPSPQVLTSRTTHNAQHTYHGVPPHNTFELGDTGFVTALWPSHRTLDTSWTLSSDGPDFKVQLDDPQVRSQNNMTDYWLAGEKRGRERQGGYDIKRKPKYLQAANMRSC
ncbi:hypothetical protein CVT25_007850 [Psilocybe cyanescens]|uniref:Uncharacterized protein n=1 Tax=Psilocybe cyanescens TaxID=93625 RepID=A0A409XJJ2_PSICY|nr:hypothetical protein CVT25_007850 [Psilocybe cyanescens]